MQIEHEKVPVPFKFYKPATDVEITTCQLNK